MASAAPNPLVLRIGLPLLDIWAAGMRALKAQGRKHSAVFSCFVDLKHSHSKGPRNQGENGGFEGVGVGERNQYK